MRQPSSEELAAVRELLRLPPDDRELAQQRTPAPAIHRVLHC